MDNRHGSFPIYIDILTSKTITLDVRISDKIEDVKRKIHEMEYISPNLQRLFFQGNELKDESKTLWDYNIKEERTLQLKALLHYIAIANTRDAVKMIAEYPSEDISSHTKYARHVLKTIPEGTRTQIVELTGEGKQFISKVEDDICFICLADQHAERRVVFAFLDDINSRFTDMHGDTVNAIHTFGLQNSFESILKERLVFFNEHPHEAMQNADVIGQTLKMQHNNIEGVQSAIVDVVERGDMLQNLEEKAELLDQQATRFEKKTIDLKKAFWWRKVKSILLGTFLSSFILLVIAMWLCGGLTFYKCSSRHRR